MEGQQIQDEIGSPAAAAVYSCGPPLSESSGPLMSVLPASCEIEVMDEEAGTTMLAPTYGLVTVAPCDKGGETTAWVRSPPTDPQHGEGLTFSPKRLTRVAIALALNWAAKQGYRVGDTRT